MSLAARNKFRRGARRGDAAESAYFSRQLEVIKRKVYETKYEDLRAREFVPTNTSYPAGTKAITWREANHVGMAKIINSYGEDLPRVEVYGTENSSVVKSTGVSYGYSVDEARTQQLAGDDLPARKAVATRRAHEELVDRIIAKGDAANNLKGFLGLANAQLYTVPNGGGGTSPWPTKTPAEIVKDLVTAWTTMRTNTRAKEVPNMLLLPDAAYTHIATTEWTAESNMSIMEYIQKLPIMRGITIDTWFELTGAGAGSVNRAVLYKRDPDVLEHAEPLPFLQHPEEKRLLEYVVPCEGKTGGVICFVPMAIMYIDGV